MDYCIIKKVENIKGALTFSEIGYVTDIKDAETINSKYDDTFGRWVIENYYNLSNGNLTIIDFFTTVPHVYNAKDTTNTIQGRFLEKITDITKL